jgi:tape measure domain-containing protein
MAITVRELVTRYGFDVDDKGLKQANLSLRKLKSAAKIAGVAIAAAGGFITSKFVKVAGDFEQFNIAFETMLGSADRAKALLQDITEFAAKTPFELPELIEGSKRLLAYGFAGEDVIETMTTLGNITAGVGREKMPQLILALGQVRAATRLRGQELRQFTEAGVPLLGELAAVTGKAESEITDMISRGEVSFDLTYRALRRLTVDGGRFANLMVKQSKTLFGVFSNIKDFLTIIGRDVGNELLPAIKELAVAFLQYLEANRKMIVMNIVSFFRNLMDVMRMMVNVSKVLFFAFGRMTEAVGGFMNMLKILTTVLLSPILILDDLIAFFQGRDSLTGRLVELTKKVLPELVGRFMAAFQPVQGFLRRTSEELTVIWNVLKGIVNLLKAPALAFFTSLGKVQKANIGFIQTVGVPALKGIMNQARTLVADVNQAYGGQAGALAGLTRPPAQLAPAGAGATNNWTVSPQVTVNVNGGATTAETGAVVGGAVKDALGQVLRETGRDMKKVIER